MRCTKNTLHHCEIGFFSWDSLKYSFNDPFQHCFNDISNYSRILPEFSLGIPSRIHFGFLSVIPFVIPFGILSNSFVDFSQVAFKYSFWASCRYTSKDSFWDSFGKYRVFFSECYIDFWWDSFGYSSRDSFWRFSWSLSGILPEFSPVIPAQILPGFFLGVLLRLCLMIRDLS